MTHCDIIYQRDCLLGMRDIPDGSVDAIVCDPPFGTMRGLSEKYEWDTVLPTKDLFQQYERVLRRGGRCILFSQEPYTSHLRTYRAHNMQFCYPLIWKKDRPGNAMMAKKAPVSLFEDISVFVKTADSAGIYPLREYAKKLMKYTGKTGYKIEKELAKAGVNKPWEVHHLIAGDGYTNIRLISDYAYQTLIDYYAIDKMDGFLPYAELKKIDAEYKTKYRQIYNLPNGRKSRGNILEYPKEAGGFHPTQKPVALIQDLIETYSNPGDLILDSCMGGGTTAIACIRSGRHYIGFETDADYFHKANRRITIEKENPRMF